MVLLELEVRVVLVHLRNLLLSQIFGGQGVRRALGTRKRDKRQSVFRSLDILRLEWLRIKRETNLIFGLKVIFLWFARLNLVGQLDFGHVKFNDGGGANPLDNKERDMFKQMSRRVCVAEASKG